MFSKINEKPLDSSVKRTQFDSTRKWVELLRKFSTDVEQQTHKRQLKNYAETFTGKQAFDCMAQLVPTIFTNRSNYSRDEATIVRNVLDNYLDSRFILNVREEQNKKFMDNATLYRLDCQRINEYIIQHTPEVGGTAPSTSNGVMRTASMRENRAQYQPHLVASRQRIFDTSKWNNQRFNELDGRLSCSMQDISSVGKKQQATQDASLKQDKKSASSSRGNLSGFSGIVGSISKASTSIFSMNRSASHQTESRKKMTTRANSNPKFLDEKVLSDDHRGQGSNPVPSTASKSIFKVETNVMAREGGIRNGVSKHNLTNQAALCGRDNPLPVFTEADEFKLWQEALMARFKKILHDAHLLTDASVHANWRTLLLPKHFSGADVRWNSKHVREDGIVKRIRETNAELPRELVVSLQHICENTSPVGCSYSGQNQQQQIRRPIRVVTGTNINNAHSAPVDGAIIGRSIATVNLHFSKLAPVFPLEFAHCLKNIFNLFGKVAQQQRMALSVSSNRRILSVNIHLLACFRLCFLTLPPNRLRSIQILLKYVQQIQSNRALSPNVAGQSLKFCHYFFQPNSTSSPASSSLTSSECNALFGLIIDHLNECLFSIKMPQVLEEDVKQLLANYETDNKISLSSPTELPTATAFCDRIDRQTYEQQNRSVQSHLHDLLNQIVANENLSEAQKFDKLKIFRLSYPAIYAQRFPPESDPLLNEPSKKEASDNTVDENIGSSLLKHLKRMAF